MKILWITNIILPAPAKFVGLPTPVTGGWMYGLMDELSKIKGIEFAVATVYSGRHLKIINEKGVGYFLLPCRNILKYQKYLEGYWNEVCNSFEPDIVHIHGTEYPHGLACMRKRPDLNYIVSIQGILSVYQQYYLGGVPYIDIIRNITFRDIARMDTLFHAKNEMRKRSSWEKEYFRRTKHVIGHKSWDRVHAGILGPGARFHFCNDTLREKFYTTKKWEIDNCRKHSLFICQGAYPHKGLHQVLKAVAMLKSEFPNLRISVAGPIIARSATWKDRLRRSGYGSYIRRMIRCYNLEAHIEFPGELDEEKILDAYLNANVFVCPSMIENNPNSLGEAQILGVPCVAAYVGGVPEMVIQGETGILYRYEEVEMLADAIRRLFMDTEYAKKISFQGTIAAENRHNSLTNSERMRSIYFNLAGK
jgi:glycosyltransferase involved in cell wall biosynthesis